jgi:hypothetical protein
MAQLGGRLSYKQEVAGSIPALRTSKADSSAAEPLSDTQETAGSTPAPPISTRDRSSAVERSPETRGCAGSIPAGHTFDSVAQRKEPPTLNRCGAGSNPAGVMWKGCHRRGTPSRKRVGLAALGGSTPSPSAQWRHGRVAQGSALLARRCVWGTHPQVRILLPPFRSGVVERQDARLLPVRRRFDPCRRSQPAPVVEGR